VQTFIGNNGLKPDYEWKCAFCSVAIDTNKSKIVVKIFGKPPFLFDLKDVRDYNSGWVERSNGSAFWKEKFHVLFTLRDIKNPTIRVDTANQKITNQLLETLNQAFERSGVTVG